jgi:serine/threonine protein kinase
MGALCALMLAHAVQPVRHGSGVTVIDRKNRVARGPRTLYQYQPLIRWHAFMKRNDCPKRIGSYQIERRLPSAVGSNMQMYAARHGLWRAQERFTITTIEPRRAKEPEFVDQFIAAASVALLLRHPNIIAAKALAFDAVHGWFLATEAVDGHDLQHLLNQGALPVSAAIYIASEMLQALSFSHGLAVPGQGSPGLVHGTLSPANVFVARDGTVKLSNTGLARVTWNHDAVMIVESVSRYMSPEQVRGAPVDGGSDLFSVGAMLWEMLTGRPLFSGANVEAVLTAIDRGPIVSPREVRPELPEDVCHVVMRLLARDPAERCGGRDARRVFGATAEAASARRSAVWH